MLQNNETYSKREISRIEGFLLFLIYIISIFLLDSIYY